MKLYGKKIMALLLSGCILSGLCGCSVGSAQAGKSTKDSSGASEGKTVKTKKAQETFKDNMSLYDEEEDDEVTTFYLTATRGNSSDGSDHSWKDVNRLMDQDYAKMHKERYKCNALLQVGDANGPREGELGYGLSSPNGVVLIRGASTANMEQKNFKIKLNKASDTYRGQRIINLNKHVSDGSRFRNKLCYDLIKDVKGLVSLRTSFVHLYVKDETEHASDTFVDYGLYTQVEQLNKDALQVHGLDRNGQLYKVNNFEFLPYADTIRLKSDSKYDKDAFEQLLEIKGNDDHQKLMDMLSDVNDSSIPIRKVLRKWFDEENLTAFLAFNMLVNNVDTQSQNYYLYSPLNGKKWYLINWDCDGSFAGVDDAVRGKGVSLGWQSGVSNYWGNVLFRRLLKDETFCRELDKKVEEVKKQLDDGRLADLIHRYKSIAKPYAFREPDAEHEELTSSEYNTMIGKMLDGADTYYEKYKESLDNPMPFYIGKPSSTGKGCQFTWDPSYDFHKRGITYTFRLSQDVTMKNPIYEKEGLYTPSCTYDKKLSSGQYFIQVVAKSDTGRTQVAFDNYFDAEGESHVGILTFFVGPDGKITLEGE